MNGHLIVNERLKLSKLRLMSEPILVLPSDRENFTLDCDASNYGLETVLLQKQSGIKKVIA